MHLSRVSISIVVGLAALIWAAYLRFIENIPLEWSHAKPFSVVVTGLLVIGLWFEHQLWRLPPFRSVVKTPDVRGTWEAELQSTYVPPGEMEPVPPIRCFFVVEQTYSTLRLGLLTPESSSSLVAHSIIPSAIGDGFQIVGLYRNEPKVGVRERSEIHRGALFLNSHGAAVKPTSLSGEYWTDRNTGGSISLKSRIDTIHSEFESAAAAFER